MSENEPIWITEADVVALMHLGQAIEALECGLRLEAAGEARNMVKTHLLWGEGHTLHAIGAAAAGAGVVGTKTWCHTAGGATPLLVLWDEATGALKAVIEAFALGQMRTGAMSGVATRWLAEEAADELALIGSGKQALTQVAAVAAVRDLKRVRVFSPSPENRAAFAERLGAEGFGFEVSAAESLESAVADAPIVTLVTRARRPFLTSGMVAAGSHVNAVGAIAPEREEFAQDLFGRCGLVAADSPPALRRLSREFMDYYGEGPGDWDQVRPICEIVAARARRPPDADLTLFKAMGMGVSDLSLGIEIHEGARRAGRGRAFPPPRRAKPRLRAAEAKSEV